MDMACSATSNWLFDYGLLDDIPFSVGEFPAPVTDFGWPFQSINVSPNARSIVEVDCSSGDSDNLMEVRSEKRLRSESYGASFSKACREKLRRNRLNERLPKTDKGAILTDAVRALTQLKSESKKLKETIESLQANIKELKAEKSELRDEKQRLRVEKEKLEQQVIAMSAQNGLLPHSPAISTAFAIAVRAQTSGNKLMPFISYPGVPMRQFMSPDVVDKSQDHILRPPMA